MDSKTTKSNTSMYQPLRSKLHHIDRQDLLSLINSLVDNNKKDNIQNVQFHKKTTENRKNNIESTD